MRVLVTGATGYIGGRLVPRLLARGHAVRCLARDLSRLQGRTWLPDVEAVQGDLLDASSLVGALEGIDVACYFVHSMGSGHGFHARDLAAARAFGEAARTAGVRRIIYLGGLGEESAALSEHLRSRQATGEALRESGVPVTEFRAAVIVGSGSLSFEMIRYLTERVPVMICPSWVYTRVQPIAVDDVLDYLTGALAVPESADRTIEIGGADVITYGEMMTGYARVRGLRRWLVPVPVLTPRLSSYWVHLVTPIPASIARPLIEGLRNEVIVREASARGLFPGVTPMSYTASVEAALAQLTAGGVETAWSDALGTTLGDAPPVTLATHEGMAIEHRQQLVDAPTAAVYRAFTALGGDTGWLAMNRAWQLRGAMDRLVGGVGMRRGRRHPQEVRVGDAVDFWRVEAIEPGRLMRLRAEMKVPGRAWLQFQALPQPDGRTLLTQTAFFAPRGLFGWLYWYALYPMHGIVFGGMIAGLAARARAEGHPGSVAG
jgi:uncharacterized protein YbjT (DUF2867 family)